MEPLKSQTSADTEWEARYQAQDMPWEKGEPSPGLVDFLARHSDLPRGTVCVPGCGTGHDVRAWVRAGFFAFGCDIAPTAIRLSEARTRELGLDAKFQLSDFLIDDPPERFDWLFEHTLFCAIEPRRRDDYVRAVLKWLKPQGHYLAVTTDPDKMVRPARRAGTVGALVSRTLSSWSEWVPAFLPWNRVGLC